MGAAWHWNSSRGCFRLVLRHTLPCPSSKPSTAQRKGQHLKHLIVTAWQHTNMSTHSAKDVSNPSQLLLSLPVHPVEVSCVFKLNLGAMKIPFGCHMCPWYDPGLIFSTTKNHNLGKIKIKAVCAKI